MQVVNDPGPVAVLALVMLAHAWTPYFAPGSHKFKTYVALLLNVLAVLALGALFVRH